MRHPTEGVLRRLLDEPAGVADADRAHVAGCTPCLGRLAEMREDAALVAAALTTDGFTDVDVAAAWRRLADAAGGEGQVAAFGGPARFRAVLRRPLVAAAAVAVVLGGASAAAATDWFEIFRTERIAPVSLSTADLNALPDLQAYGEVAFAGEPDVHPVADAAGAAEQTGLEVPRVTTLPRGVGGAPVYQAGSQVSATFTFSAARAADAAAEAGTTLPPPPEGLDGSQVRLLAGPGVAAVWSSRPSGPPSLVVGRAVAPTAYSSAVPFDTVRDYLLALPGMPNDVARQLRTFNAEGATLPLPVPAEEVTTSSARVNGAPATVLAARDKSLAAVMWVEDGVMTVVAGSLDTDEVLTVAQGLR